jgi:site-specific recombinase XerD
MNAKSCDERERAVVEFWRRGHLSWNTIQVYLGWVRKFKVYCLRRELIEAGELSLVGVRRFTSAYAGPRLKGKRLTRRTCDCAHNALHSWACALGALGETLPAWNGHRKIRALPPLFNEYREYRRAHNGVAESTLIRDLDVAQRFRQHLRDKRRTIRTPRLVDLDTFVKELATRVSTPTVADDCSSLRSFLRFLQATGRVDADLAKSVVAPRIRKEARPPRTLAWQDVQRILRSIGRSESPGKRDFAILLLLAMYGLGAAEVLGLRLQDVDWTAGILRARRPKTKVSIELPLLPPVARALTAYLRWERPPAKGTAHLFLRMNMPYQPITSGAIRHRIRHYASQAGVAADMIGAHAFRHSHASRQVDGGANLKVVSEILGHRSSSSTSVYVRVAIKRLRGVGLPVPR